MTKQLMRSMLSHLLKKVSSFRKKEKRLRESLTNTQLQLIMFHPCQTKPVSQHLFSCHSPSGAPPTPFCGPQLASTAKLEKSVSPPSLGDKPQGRTVWGTFALYWAKGSAGKRSCGWCKPEHQLVLRKLSHFYVFNLRFWNGVDFAALSRVVMIFPSLIPPGLPYCVTCLMAKAYYPLT